MIDGKLKNMQPEPREDTATSQHALPAPQPSAPNIPRQRATTMGAQVRSMLSLVANIGALIGLILVALQLQQNRELMRAQIRIGISNTIVDFLHGDAENPQLISVLRRAAVGDKLTPDEQLQFEMRSNALLRYWENVHYQFRMGLYDEAEFEAHRRAWKASMAGSVGLVAYWCRVRHLYSPHFADALDSQLTTYKCPTM